MKRYKNETLNRIYIEGKPLVYTINNILYSGIPTEEQLEQLGYYEIQESYSTPVQYLPTYEELVVQKIREQYSIDDEIALLRQRDSKPEEFAQYNTFCEACKTAARAEVEAREEVSDDD